MKNENRNVSREARDAQIADAVKLGSWTELVTEVNLPPVLATALMAGRAELIPDEYVPADAAGTKALVQLVKVLFRTNAALQRHSELVSKRAKELQDNMKGVHRHLDEMAALASFTEVAEDESGT